MKNKIVTLLALITTAICIGSVSARANQTQPGLSPFTTNPANLSDLERLGKDIFEDASLSEPPGVACISCHKPETAFQSNNNSPIRAVAQGSRHGHFGKRNVPTIAYAVFSPLFGFGTEKNEGGEIEHPPSGGQFLDGRAADLSAQVEGPLLDADEMNNPSKAAVVNKVRQRPYAQQVRTLFGDKVFDDPNNAFTKIASSVAAFESTRAFHPFSSKFDAVLRGKAAFTATEKKGFALFKNPQKGNCIACHVGKEDSKNPSDWLFTDFTYDTVGVPRNPTIPYNADHGYYDLGLCRQTGIEQKAPAGVDTQTMCGAFKVPTLRNVALTAPYMHNGAFDSLRQVVSFYATRDTSPEAWYPKNPDGSVDKFDDLPKQFRTNVNTSEAPYDRKVGETPRLNDDEIDAIVAFLKTLTDE